LRRPGSTTRRTAARARRSSTIRRRSTGGPSKLWFAHLARALIAFPGGFGTLDELMKILTLSQMRKLDRKITILLYGSSYWIEIVNVDALVGHGMIAREDLGLFQFVDDPATALRI
jgi:predicted Rossmann-fold nucleotide-binding protein